METAGHQRRNLDLLRVNEIPLLGEEGWLRRQDNAAKQPKLAQTGWSVRKNLSEIRSHFVVDHPVCAIDWWPSAAFT